MTALSILPEPPNNRPSAQEHCAQKWRASENFGTFDWTNLKNFLRGYCSSGGSGFPRGGGGGDILGARKQDKL